MSHSKIEEYNVVEYYKLTGLIERVNREIELGWLPIGGICTTNAGNGQFYYTQALVKNSSD